jgi:hypothetical protein
VKLLPPISRTYFYPNHFSKNEFAYSDITNISKANAAYVKKIVEKSNIGFFPPPSNMKESIYFQRQWRK